MQSCSAFRFHQFTGPGKNLQEHWNRQFTRVGVLQRRVVGRKQLHTIRQPIFSSVAKLEAAPPRQTTTRSRVSRATSSSSQCEQLRCSSGKGLLPGGAQRTTALIHMSFNIRPSLRLCEFGCDANPASYSTGNIKSPEPSPVNGLPVRFDPCAPGARPRTSTRAAGSPNDGTGRPQ